MCLENGNFSSSLHLTSFNGVLRTIQMLYSACFVISGSLWDPHMSASVSVDMEHKRLFIVVGFETAIYSEKYQVSIQGHGFKRSQNVSKVITLYDICHLHYLINDDKNNCVLRYNIIICVCLLSMI